MFKLHITMGNRFIGLEVKSYSFNSSQDKDYKEGIEASLKDKQTIEFNPQDKDSSDEIGVLLLYAANNQNENAIVYMKRGYLLYIDGEEYNV